MSPDRPSRSSQALTTGQRLIHVLLSAAQTALRARRLREQDPAVVQEADAALELSFGSIWERMQGIDLSIERGGITFDGVQVLSASDDPEELISSLYGAGIRRLTLTPGAEREEIKLVLSAIDAARRGRDGSDLLTFLFRADLEQVQYETAAVGPAAAGPRAAPRITSTVPGAPASPDVVRETVRQDAEADDSERGIVRLEKFDSTLYFLDEREVAYLKGAIDREYGQDLALNSLGLLLDTLELRSAADVRREVIDVLDDFLPELFSVGKFEAVALLIAGLREAARKAVDLTDAQKDALDRIRASISEPKAVSQLFHALEGGAVAPTAPSMGILLRELRPGAVRQVLAWSVRLGDLDTRASVVEALDAFFTEWPHSLSRMMNTPEREVIRAGLKLAARLKLPEFVEIVGGVTGHHDASIRKSAARALAAIATAASLRRLAGMADDADRDVRIIVYRALTARPTRSALPDLQRMIEARDLEKRGQREKRTLFEAFGSVAGQDGISTLADLLRGKNPFGPRPSSHTRACAAIALGVIGTPAAYAELERAAKDRDPLVRSAVGDALRGET